MAKVDSRRLVRVRVIGIIGLLNWLTELVI
jgi:hypothetical protein